MFARSKSILTGVHDKLCHSNSADETTHCPGDVVKTYSFDTEQAAALLDLMSHGGRLTVLQLISEDEWDVASLATTVGLSQSALSQHLKKLRDGRLVTTRRDAQTVYYSLRSNAVLKILATLEEIAAEPINTKASASAY